MNSKMKKSLIKILGVALLFALTSPACADTYSYTDASGTIHFVEDPSLIPRKYRKQSNRRVEDVHSDEPRANAATPPEVAPAAQDYSLETVNICLERPDKKNGKEYQELVKFMKERQIPFATYDMQNNRSLCTQIWCGHFIRTGGAEMMRVHPDDCVPTKMKHPPALPFYVQGNTMSYVLSRYNLTY